MSEASEAHTADDSPIIHAPATDGKFRIVSPFKPTGDQPAAIASLRAGIEAGTRAQTLLGATGTGKSHILADGKGNGVALQAFKEVETSADEMRRWVPTNSPNSLCNLHRRCLFAVISEIDIPAISRRAW